MWKPNWSELPEELLRIIAKKIEFVHDFIRFGAVCHPWRSVTLTIDKHELFLKSIPWLMLPADDAADEEEVVDSHRRFFIPFENRICSLNLPEACGCHCWGSSYGWLITFGFDQHFHLLNPLTRVRLPLPPRWTFKDRSFIDATPGSNRISCVSRAIVVSTQKPQCDYNVNDLLVVMTMGGFSEFVFARPGDKTWSIIEGIRFVKDFISFNGQFYGVGIDGNLMLFNFNDPHPTFIDFANRPDGVDGCESFYVVELGGELYMAIRLIDPTPIESPPDEFHHVYKAVFFDVLKFNFSTRKWEDMKTLGDYAIFIGSNTTFGLKASDYPSCKPNSIYFTDDFKEPSGQLIGADMGIYNIEAGTIEPLYDGDDFLSRFSPPVWITPNPF